MYGCFEKQAQRYYGLDALRGTAAILVLFYHANQKLWESTFFLNSYLAVDFFFMLSGFVIAFSYQRKLVSGEMSFKGFLLTRFVRLYPMVALGATIGTAVFWLSALRHGGMGGGAFAAGVFTFFCLPVFKFVFLFPANPAFWSLFFEAAINIGFAVCVPFTGRKTMVFTLAAAFL